MKKVDTSSKNVIYPNREYNRYSHIKTLSEYEKLYKKSIEDPELFWTNISKEFFWKIPIKSSLKPEFENNNGPRLVKFMEGAKTNVCFNVLDKHIQNKRGNQIAYYWEGNDGIRKRRITYTELRREVCKFANALRLHGIKKGDRIAIYMPVSIECVVAMLACARIGAVHVIIFAGFAPESIASRLIDAKCVLIVSSDVCYRANKIINLKNMVDSALDICKQRKFEDIINIVNKHSKTNVCEYEWNNNVDIWWHDFVKDQNDICEPEWLDFQDPIYILYTSGSSGKPKGIIHCSGGSFIYSYYVSKMMFDLNPGDVFFSTSDLGWAAAHIHTVYGGLANCATIVLLEGTPIYPKPDRIWEIIDRYNVRVFFTAPTVVRMLMKLGDHFVNAYQRDSLRILGYTGEPINRETWLWFWNIVGNGKCSIVDAYGQTETCGPMISNLPGCTPMKPGSATLPLFGVIPAVLNDDGIEIIGPGYGHLVYKTMGPGMAIGINGDSDLYESTYFKKSAGYYCTGDGVRRDSEGYYWIMGRIDDTLNVSGHLLSSQEIENAITDNSAVLEAAAVPAPHSMKGEAPFIFIVLNHHHNLTLNLEIDLRNRVREKIGAFAEPDVIVSVKRLPKNKSGKIMRRILCKIIRNEKELGDISTIEDKSVIFELIDSIYN